MVTVEAAISFPRTWCSLAQMLQCTTWPALLRLCVSVCLSFSLSAGLEITSKVTPLSLSHVPGSFCFYSETVVLKCPDRAWICDRPASASQAAGITGTSSGIFCITAAHTSWTVGRAEAAGSASYTGCWLWFHR